MKKTGANGNGNNGGNDKKLSALYGKFSTELPSRKVDDAILSAAHQNIKSAKRKKVSTSPFSSNWVVPLSLAATVVLSVSIVLIIPDADIQTHPELQMRQLSKEIPEAIEAEKTSQMNQAQESQPKADRKQPSAQSLESKAEKKGPQLLRKKSAKQQPAMAPAESSAPASVAPTSASPLRSLEEADTTAPQVSKPGVAPASSQDNTRSQAAAPKKSLQKKKIQAMANARLVETKKTFANVEKVKPGMNKQAVLALLGEPDKKTETSWLYRIVENNQAQNYTITFENNKVTAVEMIAPALKQPVPE